MRAAPWLLLAALCAGGVGCNSILGIDHHDQAPGDATATPVDAPSPSPETGPDANSDTGMHPLSEAGDATVGDAFEAGDVTVEADTGQADTGGGPDGDTGASEPPMESGPDGPSCTDACTLGQTRCTSGGVQTCQAGAGSCTLWVTTKTCGSNQSCTVGGADAGAMASCTCKASACTQVGMICQDTQTLGTCAKDADGCFYVSSTSMCATPKSCSGIAPGAVCSLTCSDSCTQGQTSCVSGGLATCTVGSNGCRSYGAPAACGAHQSCTGAAGAAACTCNTDPVCTAAGTACSDSTHQVACASDSQNCVYQSGAPSACPNGACSGSACSNICEFDNSTFDNGCVFAP
jgi:hypothetical protein